MEFILQVIVAGVIFVAIDAIWLSAVANKFYKQQLGSLLAPKPNMVAAAAFYVLYMIGTVVFALNPALDKDSLACAIGLGALLGLVMYATYDLTNQATLKNWPAKVTYVDLTWGTFVTATVTGLTFLLFQ